MRESAGSSDDHCRAGRVDAPSGDSARSATRQHHITITITTTTTPSRRVRSRAGRSWVELSVPQRTRSQRGTRQREGADRQGAPRANTNTSRQPSLPQPSAARPRSWLKTPPLRVLREAAAGN